MMKTMKYIPFIVAVWALIATTACTTDDMGTSKGYLKDGNVVTVMGRITRFKDYEVNNRAAKQGDEGKITSMALAIFPVTETNGVASLDGDCVYYNYSADGSELLFTIDRSSDETNFELDKRYVMYVFANIPGMASFGVGSSLEEMLKVTTNIESLDIPTNGFPMVGSLGDTFSTTFEKDNQTFVLSPTENGELVAPKVNGQSQNLLTIPMKAMYAKMNFIITVRPDQTVEGNYSPEFTLTDYKVCDVPVSVDCNNATNETNVNESLDGLSITGNLSASGANTIKFSFYLPEQLLEPDTSSDNYGYPFGKGSELREEDKVYRQRYKSKLLGDGQKAAHIVISGRYRDHQNHYYDVDYTIYLGKDNYGDFNIERNCEYNNYITIRGILTSADASNNGNAISIDHRVNVERTQPAIISLRREVLLDSHFEVRPLRVRSTGIDSDNINAVMVEVLEPNLTKWVRIERSFGDGTADGSPTNDKGKSIYINEDEDEDANDASYGKRRYFTYNLVNGLDTDGTTPDSSGNSLVNSTQVIVPLGGGGDCVWIYVDECLETGDEVRSGAVKVTYGNGTTIDNFVATTNQAYPPVEYTISQRKLFQVTYDNRTYNIEYQEEYLHNFDADEDYGQTEYEGMMWGLNGIQLSYDHQAISFNDGLSDWLTSGVRPYYDFYISKYDATDATSSGGTLHSYEGYDFCKEIIQVVNGEGKHDTDSDNNIDVLQLNEQPRSAIEYCYNKNKRNANGQVVWLNSDETTYNQSQLNWYLPAIDEMEDIIVSEYGNSGMKTYSRFLDFQNKYYWSSQPAFIKNFAYYQGIINSRDKWGAMYIDNVNNARATKVNYSADNGFDYARSGINLIKDDAGNDVYYKAWHYVLGGIFGTNTYDPEDGTVTIDDRITITLQEISTQAQPGYKARNSMARVRCVRKLQ